MKKTSEILIMITVPKKRVVFAQALFRFLFYSFSFSTSAPYSFNAFQVTPCSYFIKSMSFSLTDRS